MNEILINIGWVFVFLQACALLLFLWLARASVRSLLFERPNKEPNTEFEHSFFIYICVSLVFQGIGFFIGDIIFSIDMGVQAKRQVFYIYYSIHEALFMVVMLQWHNYKRCEFARMTTYGFYVSFTLMMLFLLRYVDRVIFNTEILRGIHSQVIALANLCITLIFLSYPLMRLHHLIKEKLFNKKLPQ